MSTPRKTNTYTSYHTKKDTAQHARASQDKRDHAQNRGGDDVRSTEP